MSPSYRRAGFTLIELVVAVAIFAVLAALAYGGLANTLDARERITQHQDELALIETAFALLESDVANVVPRGVRDELGGTLPALAAPADRPELEFTRYVDNSFDTTPTIRLRRIGYELAGGRLVRKTWPVLDRIPGMEPTRRVLLDDVEQLSFRFHAQAWFDYWPRAAAVAVSADVLPRAVEVNIQFRNGNGARRILLLEAGS